MAVSFFWCTTGERNTNQLINEFEQTLEEKQDERSEVEKEQTTVSKEEKAILKEGSIIGIIEIPGIDIRYPVMEETGSEMLNAGTWFVLDDSPFHVFVLSFSMVEGGQSAKARCIYNREKSLCYRAKRKTSGL